MSAEIDSLVEDSLTELHAHMDETEGFKHHPYSESDALSDKDFTGIFSFDDVDGDEQDDFMLSVEYDAVIHCQASTIADIPITFNKGDLISRKKDMNTYAVLTAYNSHGEIIVVLARTEMSARGTN